MVVVGTLLAMLAAIEFDNEAASQTDEIDDVAGDGKLSAKFVSAQSSVAQMSP